MKYCSLNACTEPENDCMTCPLVHDSEAGKKYEEYNIDQTTLDRNSEKAAFNR